MALNFCAFIHFGPYNIHKFNLRALAESGVPVKGARAYP